MATCICNRLNTRTYYVDVVLARSQHGLSMVLSANSSRSQLFLSTVSALTHHSLSTVSALSQINLSVSLSYSHKYILQKFQLVWAVTLSSYRATGTSKNLMGTSIDGNGVKVAFSQKVLMRLSFLQTDKPNYFPELKF